MINRALWTGSFQREYFPAWTCSKCEIGIFELIPEHFYYTEDADTLAEINNPHFDYELVRYRFSSVLNCNNINCKETSILTGWGANHGLFMNIFKSVLCKIKRDDSTQY